MCLPGLQASVKQWHMSISNNHRAAEKYYNLKSIPAAQLILIRARENSTGRVSARSSEHINKSEEMTDIIEQQGVSMRD